MKTAAALASCLGWCAWAGVNLHPAPAPAVLPGAEIYQRATNEFAEADFFKPAEPKTNDLAFTLAPLILQEVPGANEPLPRPDRFGTLGLSNGLPVLDPSRPAVYWQADTIQFNGTAHARFAYVWFYSPRPYGSERGPSANNLSTGRAEPAFPSQGIRLTLNSAGQPVIWEVLADRSCAELIFVSQNLEAAAATRFGKALPGRRYAIERSLEEAPNTIVARVIDDGPVAMGPIVYLNARARTVSTLICRCMTAQVKILRTTTVYDLLPFQATPAQSLLTQARALARERTAFWPGDAPGDSRLEHCLRLVSAF